MFHHIVIDAAKIGSGVSIIIGHDLFEHEIGLADHILVKACPEAALPFHISGRGEHLALAVPPHRRAEARIDDFGAGFGGGGNGRHEKPIGEMAVVADDQLRPGFADFGDQGADKSRGTDAGHIFETQNNHAAGLPGAHAGDISYHIDNF